MNQLDEYLHAYFPGLNLKPSLYQQWPIGLHFELGKGLYQFNEGTDELNMERFYCVYSQATSMFNEIFSDEDEVFLVTNMYKHKTHHSNQRMKVFHRNLRNKDLKFQLKHKILPYTFDEEENSDEYYTARYSLKCHRRNLKFQQLIRGACHEDFPLKPKFGGDYTHYPDVFFINISKNIIFYIYDDRGCEVIASDLETIRPLYEKYRGWIPEYDQEKVIACFT